jgi:hypothetical protein
MGGTVSLVPGLNTASCSVGTEAPGGLGCVSYMGGTVCLYQKKSMENFDDVHCVCVWWENNDSQVQVHTGCMLDMTVRANANR